MKNFCPVCYEYLLDSIKATKILKCGHTMHRDCFNDMKKQNMYRCPICSKTMRDISVFWKLLDEEIEATVMPEEYRYDVSILCNDCNNTGKACFHILGHKCHYCNSYNTRRLSAPDN
ncbi:E3 ubiquitin-protein ligase MIEL1 [Juglans microcarpa x Juglans regia]|uniref:E3 ubiquitin-protein ligase MIEL1 n=1 Tax=Juglans microcarpa x Juglans regia TaxID=2249226 RepID=UPI001B7E756A|nr:E3 ubiquitin-protein ligase MIEL1 [Juglans microcarpa x Juglans regia]